MPTTKSVRLTPDQLAFVKESLGYSAQRFRDYDYSSQDPAWAAERRKEKDEMIASIREAIADAEPA